MAEIIRNCHQNVIKKKGNFMLILLIRKLIIYIPFLQKITRFRSRHFFLSNMFPVPIRYKGIKYNSVEHAFQASKCIKPKDAMWIRSARTPSRARILGKRIKLRANWSKIRVKIMFNLLKEKFKNPKMRQLLNDTKNDLIIEENSWHDTFWGKCICEDHNNSGENILGKMLMYIRDNNKM